MHIPHAIAVRIENTVYSALGITMYNMKDYVALANADVYEKSPFEAAVAIAVKYYRPEHFDLVDEFLTAWRDDLLADGNMDYVAAERYADALDNFLAQIRGW